jgi:hypothetical protein
MRALKRVDPVRGTVVLPKAVREGVDLVEIVRRPDGVIELRPRLMIDPTQSWFWTTRWQEMERQADEDIAAGRVATFDDADAFVADLRSARPTTRKKSG